MKNWIKQQLTEMTAWAGVIMIVGAYLFPAWLFVTIGMLLIASDDTKFANFIKKCVPWLSSKVDEL